MSRILDVLQMIADDMEADVKSFEGKPFTGKTLGELHGNLSAAVQALAKILAGVVEDQDKLIAASRQAGFDEAMDQAGTKWAGAFRERQMPLSATMIEKAVTEYKAKRGVK